MLKKVSDLGLSGTHQELLENAAHPAPLHPELEPWLCPAEKGSMIGWDTLKHPLVFAVPYMPSMNYMYNKQFEAKTEAVREYEAKKDWGGFVFMHERPHRFDALEAICHRLDGPSFWDLMGSVWSDSENLWQVGPRRLRKFLSMHPGDRRHFMNEDETNFFDRLPDQIRVFRGHQGNNRMGFSWTLAYNTSAWFARRFERDGKISQGVVSKSDVVGLLCGRNEMEVVVDSRKVGDIQEVKLVPRPESMQRVLRELLGQFRLPGRTDHGLYHWNKVDRNAIELCRRIPEADLEVARWFCIFHDSCREDESRDPQHGFRAAELLTQMYKDGKVEGLTEEQFTKLHFAVQQHNGGKPTTDPTIGVCFDADRLDLLRVGILPNPKLLSTEAARGLICMI